MPISWREQTPATRPFFRMARNSWLCSPNHLCTASSGVSAGRNSLWPTSERRSVLSGSGAMEAAAMPGIVAERGRAEAGKACVSKMRTIEFRDRGVGGNGCSKKSGDRRSPKTTRKQAFRRDSWRSWYNLLYRLGEPDYRSACLLAALSQRLASAASLFVLCWLGVLLPAFRDRRM